jgi:hypothetical protein
MRTGSNSGRGRRGGHSGRTGFYSGRGVGRYSDPYVETRESEKDSDMEDRRRMKLIQGKREALERWSCGQLF